MELLCLGRSILQKTHFDVLQDAKFVKSNFSITTPQTAFGSFLFFFFLLLVKRAIFFLYSWNTFCFFFLKEDLVFLGTENLGSFSLISQHSLRNPFFPYVHYYLCHCHSPEMIMCFQGTDSEYIQRRCKIARNIRVWSGGGCIILAWFISTENKCGGNLWDCYLQMSSLEEI